MNTSPVKENDRSYDSRESVDDHEPQPTKTITKKAATTVTRQEQSVPQNTEEPLSSEASQRQKQEVANPQSAGEQEKKTKKKKAKKTEEKAVENGENVTQQNVVQEEKPKKTKKKAAETETNNQLAEVKKVENVETATGNTNNTQTRAKSAKKTQKTEETPVAVLEVQKVAKEAGKTQEVVVQQKTTKQEPENKKPQTKQENRGKNLQVSEPTASRSVLVSALVSPANQKNGKNVAAATPKATEAEPRYSKNTFPTQQNEERPTAYSRGQSVNVQNAPTLKKSPTQGELSTASSPKSKLGPIKSKIQTGLSDNQRTASKKGDTSEINQTMTTQKAKSPTNAANRPKTSEKLNTTTHKSYILEKVDTPAHANQSAYTDMKKKRTEKPRLRSFDATKTDKIRADDTFETRSRMWQVRKAEKLREEEKKKYRKELENCTFAPTTNQKLLPEELTASTIYDRGVDWSEKVKTHIATKGEEIIEAAKRPEPKKPRVKSFNAPPEIRSTRVYVEGFTGPQFGTSKTVSVPTFSQDPLEFRGNLDEKVNEICTLYDNLTSHLKKKSIVNQSKPTSQEKPKSKVNEVKSATASRSSLVSQKERSIKVEPVSAGSNNGTVKGDEQRLSSLRGILNMTAKKNQNTAVKDNTKEADQEQDSGTLPGESDAASKVLQTGNQRVEIRNNRYVVIEDDNISAIEKNSNFDMSLNFDASTARQQLV